MRRMMSFAALAAVLMFAAPSMAADNPPDGQSSSQLNSMSPQSGSPSNSGNTGIGSTSGADASVGTGLKSTTQPVPCQGPGSMRSDTDVKAKADQNMDKQNTEKRSAADAARDAMANVKTPSGDLDRDTARNPEARSNAETSNRMSSGC